MSSTMMKTALPKSSVNQEMRFSFSGPTAANG